MSPLRPAKQSASLPCWIFLLAACLTMSFAGVLKASPYDGYGTRPGQIIENRLEVTWAGSSDRIEAFDTFEVGAFPFQGEIQILGQDPGGTPQIFRPLQHASTPGSGNYTPSPVPLTVDGHPIDTQGQPLPVSPADVIRPGMPILLLVKHTGLNTDPSSRQHLVVELTDRETGDVETLRLEETLPDSGVFAGAINSKDALEIARDGTMSTQRGSRITASFEDPWRPGNTASVEVFVAPFSTYGQIFDSRTGLPLDGVTVTLVEAESGQQAEVYGNDLTAFYPAQVVTGQATVDASGTSYPSDPGSYFFPHVPPGQYYFEVNAPDGFTAPSLATDAELQSLPGAPFNLGAASRLEAFDVLPGQRLAYDIPLDGEGFLSVLREGSSDELGIGDFIRYEISVSTNVDGTVIGRVHDTLPMGLHLLEKTIEIDGERPLSEPVISSGGEEIIFPDLSFPSGRPLVISYTASVSTGADPGSTLRSASRAMSARLLSNTATHDLQITDSLSQSHDILLGRVRADGCQAAPGPQPIDLSGVRLLLEDGRYAQSDSQGRFTFRQVARGAHVVAIDPLSLPRGWQATLCEDAPSAAGSAMSRFVEARGGFARQITFHIAPGRFVDHPDPIAPDLPRSADFDKSWISRHSDARDFVFPPEGHLPRGQSIDVLAARAPRESLQLTVNGAPTNPLARRPSVLATDGRAMLDSWKGLPLNSGRNELSLERRSEDGKVISRTHRSVYFNEAANRIEVLQDASVLESDGRTRPVVVLRISNQDGIPLHPGTLAKIMVDAPQAFSTILRKNGTKVEERSPSVTAKVDADGLIRLRLAAPTRPGPARFTTFTEEGVGETKAYISSSGHPWIAAGIASTAASGSHIADHLRPQQDEDLGSLGGVHLSGRGAFYARGVLFKDWLLTLRYDSSLHRQTADFSDTQVNEDRLVFGDDSKEGDLAASRDPIYLHLEGRKSDLLYGDFDTGYDDGTARYSRRLTGARAHYEDKGLDVSAFVTGSDQRYLSESFPGDGTTGPFDLSSADILGFSERVVIEITSSRDPSEVIERRELRRGEDYDIDYAKGRLFLRDPLPARDSMMNPQALIIDYELEEVREKGVTAGGRAVLKTAPGLSFGATLVREDNVSGTSGAGNLYGLDLAWQNQQAGNLSLAVGQSHQEASRTLPEGAGGHAAEMKYSQGDDRGTIEARLRSESTTFGIDNQSSDRETVISGDLEATLALGVPATAEVQPARRPGTNEPRPPSPEATPKIELEAVLHAEENLQSGDKLQSSELALSRQSGEARLRGGFRLSNEIAGDAHGTALQAIASHENTAPGGRLRYSYGLETTLDRTGEPDAPDRLVATAEWDATDRLVLKTTTELVHDTDVSAGILGVGGDMNTWEGATLSFGAIEATTSQGSHVVGTAGLRQEVVLSQRSRLRFALDHQELLFGRTGSDGPVREAGLSNPLLDEGYTAASIGVDLDRGDWRHEGMIELRHAKTSNQARLRAQSVRKISETRVAGIHASLFALQDKDGSFEQDHEIGASLAWRPLDRESALLEHLDLRHDADDDGAETRLVNALRYTSRLSSGGELHLHHGAKIARFDLADEVYTDLINLVGAEYRHPITGWLDAGFQGAALHSLRSGTSRGSLGASLGFTPFDNGWISVGFNGYGFRDEDFRGAGYLDAGAFIQFRLKIDSDSFRH